MAEVSCSTLIPIEGSRNPATVLADLITGLRSSLKGIRLGLTYTQPRESRQATIKNKCLLLQVAAGLAEVKVMVDKLQTATGHQDKSLCHT